MYPVERYMINTIQLTNPEKENSQITCLLCSDPFRMTSFIWTVDARYSEYAKRPEVIFSILQFMMEKEYSFSSPPINASDIIDDGEFWFDNRLIRVELIEKDYSYGEPHQYMIIDGESAVIVYEDQYTLIHVDPDTLDETDFDILCEKKEGMLHKSYIHEHNEYDEKKAVFKKYYNLLLV